MRKFTHPLRTLRSCAQLRTLAHFLRTFCACVLLRTAYSVRTSTQLNTLYLMPAECIVI